LHQPGVRGSAVGAASLGTKVVQRGERAPSGDFEDRALAVGSAGGGCSVKVPVGCLHERKMVGARPVASVETHKSVEGLCVGGNCGQQASHDQQGAAN
jgi:hypothetical protein